MIERKKNERNEIHFDGYGLDLDREECGPPRLIMLSSSSHSSYLLSGKSQLPSNISV